MLTSFLIAAGLVVLLVLMRTFSIGEDVARYVAKAERPRIQMENEGTPLATLDEDAFIAYYEWLRRRRFWQYFAMSFVLAAFVTLILMMGLAFLKEVANPGPWMWGFIAVFVLTAGWTACVAGILYLHRKRRDASLVRNFSRWPEGKGAAFATNSAP